MANKDIIPLFTTDASLGKSILTSDEPKDIDESSSISVWSIAKTHNLNPVHIIEDSMIGYINHYKYSLKLDKDLVFGLKFKVVNDSLDITPESFKTESNIVVFMRNSDGYKDLIKLSTAINADTNRCIWDKFARKYYNRADWKLIKEYWTDNLELIIPFYDSFLHLNTLEHGHYSIPEFGKIKPIFILEEHDLPFDDIIKNSVVNYCKENKYETANAHSIFYYKNQDLRDYQVDRCIATGSTFQMPNMEYFSQDTFSFESWKK